MTKQRTRPNIAPLNAGRNAYVKWWYHALRAEGCAVTSAKWTAHQLAARYWNEDGTPKHPHIESLRDGRATVAREWWR